MTKKFIIAPLVALAMGICAQAQTQKIGIINMQDALVATKDGQKAVAELRGKYSPKDQELQKRQQELTAKQEQLGKTQNTLSETARASLEREIGTLQRNMQRDMDDVKQDMDSDQQRMVNELGQKMMQVISKYSADNQYTAVFDVSGQPNNILYAATAADITQAVIALYDKAAAVTPTAAPSKAPATSAAPRPVTPAAPRPLTSAPAPAIKK